MEKTRIQIGSCRLDLASNDLECSRGTVTHLTQKSCELLDLLVRHQGEMVTRQTLIETVWGTNDLNNEKRLNDEIWKIRSILSEVGAEDVTIKTIPRKGYLLLISPAESAEPAEKADSEASFDPSGAASKPAWPVYAALVLVPLMAWAWYYHTHTVETLNSTIENQQSLLNRQFLTKMNTVDFFVQLFRVSDKPALSKEELELRLALVADAENKLTSFAADKATYAQLLQSVGIMYFQLGSFREAESSMTRALQANGDLYGTDSWEYFSNLLALAEIQWAAVKPDEARASYEEALAIAENSQFESSEIAKAMNGLGVIYMTHFGLYEEAEALHLGALGIRQAEFGNLNEQVAGSLENLGYLYSNMGRLSESAAMYQQAYDARVKLNGPESPRVARIMTNLANVYLNMDDYEPAIELSEKVEAIYASVHGENYFARGISFVTLAQAYLRMDQLDKAQEYAAKSLQILLHDQRENSMSARHVGYAYMIMGDVIAAQGEAAQAQDYFEKGFYSFNQIYGLDHPRTQEARTRLDDQTP